MEVEATAMLAPAIPCGFWEVWFGGVEMGCVSRAARDGTAAASGAGWTGEDDRGSGRAAAERVYSRLPALFPVLVAAFLRERTERSRLFAG